LTDGRRITFDRAIVVAVALFALLYGIKASRKEGDLDVYRHAAEHLLEGSRIYRNEPDAFPYPPFCALLFVPFTFVGVREARIALYLIDLAAIAVMVRSVRSVTAGHASRDGPPVRPWLTPDTATALGVLLTARFILSAIDNQQSDLLLVAAVLAGLDALRRGHELRSGILLAMGVGIKLTPLLFLPYLLLVGHRRAALSMCLSTALLILLPEILFPSSSGTPLIRSWYEIVMTKTAPWEGGVPWAAGGGIWTSTNILNQSLPATMFRYLADAPIRLGGTGELVSVGGLDLSPSTIRVVVYAAEALLLIVSGFTVVRGGGREADESPAFGVVLCLMLLLSPQSSKPHFSSLVLPHALLLRHLRHHRGIPVVLVIGFSILTLTLSAEGFAGRRLSDLLEAHGVITMGTLAVWAGLLVISRQRVPGRPGRIRVPQPAGATASPAAPEERP
jgi:hypothetical protein